MRTSKQADGVTYANQDFEDRHAQRVTSDVIRDQTFYVQRLPTRDANGDLDVFEI